MFNKLFGNLEEGSVKIGGSEVEYAAFGRGETSLVAIPGLSEGLRTIKGTGKMLWFMYRGFARTHRMMRDHSPRLFSGIFCARNSTRGKRH